MFSKLIAIWKIIRSDKYAVFTYTEAPEDPEWLTAPRFSWVVSGYDSYLFQLIKNRLECLIRYTRNLESDYEKTDSKNNL